MSGWRRPGWIWAVLLITSARGASTWTGGGGNVNWSTAGNWSGGTPTSAATTDLIFAGTTNLGSLGTPLNQDIANPMLLNTLTFNSGAGAFFLGGNPLRWQGASNTITQSSSTAQNIANSFSAPSTNSLFTINLAGSGSGLITLSGIISSGNGARDYAIVKSGTSSFALNGNNSYAGGTTINGGTLSINSATSLGAATGGLTINAGTLEISAGFSTSRVYTLGDAASTIQVDPSQTLTITSAIGGASGALTKTGAGTLVLSASNTYLGGTNINAGTLQVNNSGALSAAGTISFGGGTLQYTAANTTDYSSRFSTAASQSYKIDTNSQNVTFATALSSSGGSLTKAGTGTLTLTGTNTFTGATTVNGGTLLAAGSSGAALGSTSGITVNSGGTLQLGANNQINNSATMTLAGGTFAKGNFTEGATNAVGIGALTLSAAGSHIDFGTGTIGILTFASLNPSTFTLVIDNWTGTANTQGTGSTDRLIFDSDQASNLSAFSFTGFAAGAMEFNLGGGFWEVVAVPEPANWVSSGLAALALGGFHFQQRRRRILARRLREKVIG